MKGTKNKLGICMPRQRWKILNLRYDDRDDRGQLCVKKLKLDHDVVDNEFEYEWKL